MPCQTPLARPDSAGSSRLPSTYISAPSSGQKPPIRPGSAGSSRPPSTHINGRALPAELGLAGQRVLDLPAELDTCSQGERCCWRWLAHAVLKEASWMKDDLDKARQDYIDAVSDHAQVQSDAEAYAELRGEHKAMLLQAVANSAKATESETKLATLQKAYGHKAAREQELERQIAKMEMNRKAAEDRELALLRRAESAEHELVKSQVRAESTNQRKLQLEEIVAEQATEIKKLNDEHAAEMQRRREAQEAKKKKGKRRPRSAQVGIGRLLEHTSSSLARKAKT